MSVFTKKAIIESFKKILETKNFDKITIKDIIEESGVSRSTFYYHFADIYELAEATFEYECQPLILDKSENISWKELLLDATQLAKESRKQLYHAYNNIDRQKLETYLYGIVEKAFIAYIDSLSKEYTVTENDKEFIITCYSCALVGMIMKWIDQGMQDDAAMFIEKIEVYFKGSIDNLLEKNQTKS
jgi:probable dihydroxyacetone kinase regulator